MPICQGFRGLWKALWGKSNFFLVRLLDRIRVGTIGLDHSRHGRNNVHILKHQHSKACVLETGAAGQVYVNQVQCTYTHNEYK